MPFDNKSLTLNSIRLFVVFEIVLWILCSAERISEKCKIGCNEMKSDFRETSGWHECNVTCRIEQCSRGCSLWNQSTNGSCSSSCVISANTVGVDFCVQSCSAAIKMYINEMAHEFANLPSPVLTSSGNVSVLLRWSANPVPVLEPGFTLTFLLQKLTLGLSDDWQFHNSVKWLSAQRVRVSDLRPYVTYKFRIVVVISDDVIISLPESSPISTEPSGTPLQAPEVVSLTTTSTSVHLKAKPPFFVNGPLVGFKLTVSRGKRESDARIKEIISHGNRTISEVITMLQPDTEYEVRLATINRYGVGPELAKTVRTRSQNLAFGGSAYLLICADNKLLRQDLSDIFRDSDVLFEDPDETVLLTEVAVHYAQNLIFLAMNDERIHRINVSDGTRLVRNISAVVHGLTVDWLHDFLYLAVDNKILQCDLNIASCHLAVDLKNSTTVDMHVDPCNGYLYWTQRGGRMGGGGASNGLYCLDLDRLKAFDCEAQAVALGNLSAFAIDYLNYRLFYPNETIHTMISIYLDGSDPVNIRTNTQNPDFSLVSGLAYNAMNSTFFWTNGEKLMMEEYDFDHMLYHHNQMFIDGDHFGAVGLWGPGPQPTPVPILPPKRFQALLSTDSGILSWLPPESDQGKGAWQQWLYEVEISNVDGSKNRTLTWINTTQVKVGNLNPGVLHRFRVRGTSAGGAGPWSDYFVAQTLRADGGSSTTILYASGSAILEKSLDGSRQKSLMNSTTDNSTITELAISAETLFLATTSGLFVFEQSSQSAARFSDRSNVGVLAYDCLANRIYWTNTKLNLIKRMPVSTVTPSLEWAPQLDEILLNTAITVQDLVLDTAEARMYWTTSSTVETAHLDGQGHRILQKLPSFSGQYILGLATDIRGRLLLWMTKDLNKLTIFKMKLIGLDDGTDFKPSIERVLEFTGKAVLPSLDFHSNKLFWMEQKNVLCILDLRGNSISRLQMSAANETDIAAFAIRPSKVHFNDSDLQLIPDTLDVNTLLITELENNCSISWVPSFTSRGVIYYRVWWQVDASPRQEKRSYDPYIFLLGLKVYSEIEVYVVACSYWGCGDQIHKTFHSLVAEKSVQGQLTFALSTSLGVILALTMLAFCVLLLTCIGQKDKKSILSFVDLHATTQNNMDHELATLRHLPNVALETSNILYASSFLPGNEDFASLPHFPHSRLRLTKFLGSGAFGKVFEGIAVNILHEHSGETKVAVKTLHKSASDNEKEEFLKEALLMNNFKHDQILRLLGVSLDHDPQFLILELMDGGDLLTFLRASRPSFVTDAKLTILDMIGICMDVGKGCEYLEDMHFVHRDLAARNCLVSFAGSSLVVKIGDFGLARDIYRNDYYKKEGEGLLPVRWMSPESLIDGIFTTQSDVWAYGVLMWEVLTLGQQPYPTLTNLEVLHFVRSGGRLDCPENCPNDLYHLMLKCWIYLPSKRPSFHDIVKQLNVLSHQATIIASTPQLPSSGYYSPAAANGCRLKVLQSSGASNKERLKTRHSSEDDSNSGSDDVRPTGSRELTILDSLLPFVANKTRPRRNGFVRSDNICQGNGCQGNNCQGGACGYLEPSRHLGDQHPKYLELIDLTLSSLTDSSSTEG